MNPPTRPMVVAWLLAAALTAVGCSQRPNPAAAPLDPSAHRPDPQATCHEEFDGDGALVLVCPDDTPNPTPHPAAAPTAPPTATDQPTEDRPDEWVALTGADGPAAAGYGDLAIPEAIPYTWTEQAERVPFANAPELYDQLMPTVRQDLLAVGTQPTDDTVILEGPTPPGLFIGLSVVGPIEGDRDAFAIVVPFDDARGQRMLRIHAWLLQVDRSTPAAPNATHLASFPACSTPPGQWDPTTQQVTRGLFIVLRDWAYEAAGAEPPDQPLSEVADVAGVPLEVEGCT